MCFSVAHTDPYGVCLFFFSSRRRHTRWNCDWSSDVCSSDLEGGVAIQPLDVVFPGVAVGAVNPHALGPIFERGLAGEIFRHAGFHVAALAAVEGAGSSRAARARVAISPSLS